VVYRHRRMIQVFRLVEHGRRVYRVLCYSRYDRIIRIIIIGLWVLGLYPLLSLSLSLSFSLSLSLSFSLCLSLSLSVSLSLLSLSLSLSVSLFLSLSLSLSLPLFPILQTQTQTQNNNNITTSLVLTILNYTLRSSSSSFNHISDARYCLHSLPPNTAARSRILPHSIRRAAGNIRERVAPQPSLVAVRRRPVVSRGGARGGGGGGGGGGGSTIFSSSTPEEEEEGKEKEGHLFFFFFFFFFFFVKHQPEDGDCLRALSSFSAASGDPSLGSLGKF